MVFRFLRLCFLVLVLFGLIGLGFEPACAFAVDSSAGSESEQTGPRGRARMPESDMLLHQRLRRKYRGMSRFKSDVNQIKTSPYLSVPLRSTVRLEWEKGRVLWKTLKPVASEVWIADGRIRVTDASGRVTDLVNSAAGGLQGPAQRVLGAVVLFIEQLFSFDLVELEKDFSFSESGNSLYATVRPDSRVDFFRSFTLSFDEDLTLKKLVLQELSGQTEMEFTGVELESGGTD
jgi:hypothetical protein